MNLATRIVLFALAASAGVTLLGSQPTPSLTFIVETWQLANGGVDPGNKSSAYLDLNLDGEHSAGAMKYHTTFLAYDGNREVDRYTGDFGVYSNLITDSEWIVFTAWIEMQLGDTESTLRIGQLASDETFYTSDTGGLFLNANFGALPTVSANTSAPIYSVGSGGIEIVSPTRNGYAAFGAYAGDPGPGDEDDHGFNWRAGGDAGYTFIGELGWNYALGQIGKGVFKAGSYLTTGEVELFESGNTDKGNHAFYAVFDQQIASIGEAPVHGFLRYGFNPLEDRSVVENYLDFGAAISRFLPQRPNDTMGIAFSRMSFSKDYIFQQRASGESVNERERVVEFSYQATIGENWSAQFSAQWIEPPHRSEEDALLFGLRLVSEL